MTYTRLEAIEDGLVILAAIESIAAVYLIWGTWAAVALSGIFTPISLAFVYEIKKEIENGGEGRGA